MCSVYIDPHGSWTFKPWDTLSRVTYHLSGAYFLHYLPSSRNVFHISSMLSKLFSIDPIGYLDLNLLDGVLFMSLYTGILIELLIFCRILTVVRCLRAASGDILKRTERHCWLVDETQFVIVRIVLFSRVSIFFACALLSQTGVQYFVTLYTMVRANMRRIFYRKTQLVPTNLLIVFQQSFQMIPFELLAPHRSHTQIYTTRYLWSPLCRDWTT